MNLHVSTVGNDRLFDVYVNYGCGTSISKELNNKRHSHHVPVHVKVQVPVIVSAVQYSTVAVALEYYACSCRVAMVTPT